MKKSIQESWSYNNTREAAPRTIIDITDAIKELRSECEESGETAPAYRPEMMFYDFSAVPKEMKQLNCWVCWAKEERNGKTTKLPKNPKTGGNASTALSGTWATYTEANRYYLDHAGDIRGIGYVFTESNSIIGIDIDNCIKHGQIISEELREIVGRCSSYVETSPSGTGLHIYIKGKWKEVGGRKNNKIGNGMAIEVYPSSRFFTVTGNAFGGIRPLAEDQEFLDEIYDQFFAVKKETAGLLPARVGDLGVEPVYVKRLQARLENKHSWLSMLWQGNHTKKSESEADMALICRLLKLCDGDEDSVKKLFMASPFAQQKDTEHRKKLKRDDYWRMSFDNAIEYLERHPEFDRLDRFRPLLRHDGDNDGRASMLFEYVDGNIRFCTEQETWLIYKDGCWLRDESLLEIKTNAVEMYTGLKATAKAMIAEKRFDDEKDKKKAKDYLYNKIKGFGNKYGINGVIDYAASYRDFRISETELDSHDELLGAGNGIISLRTGELLPFDRQLYITRRTEVYYNPDALEPRRFLRFLNEISGGDQAWVDYLQLVLGYCITGCTNQEAFIVLHGETGNNGKSTLLKLLVKLLPQHIKTMGKVALEECKNSTDLNSSLAQAKHYRMVIANENDGKRQLNESLVRTIASGEPHNLRDLYEKAKSYAPHYKIVFCGNFVPKFNWRLYANLRRLCLIPFNITIPNSKVDINLEKKLWEEREGILAWIVAGAKRSFTESIKKKPPVVEEYTRALMFTEDPVYGFCQEVTTLTDEPEDTIQATDLFEAYNDWREWNDLSRLPYKESITAFGQRLKQLGFKKRYNAQKQVIYFGIRLHQDYHNDEDSEESDNQE